MLFVNSLGGAEQTIALLGDADFLQGPLLARLGGRSGQPGPEQRGFWRGGAANHLLSPLGHRGRMAWRLAGCAPLLPCAPVFKVCPPPPTTQERPLGRERLLASKGMSGQRLLLGTHARLAAEWKRVFSPTFSNLSLCGSPGTQRFPWGLCCFQEHQAPVTP